jgi:asparagine synthase (glutamine-hydrolysing)
VIGYAALRWDSRDASASATANAVTAILPDHGMSRIVDVPGLMVVADTGAVHLVRSLSDPNRIVIGQLFDRRATDQSRYDVARIDGVGATFASLCRFLLNSCWGTYLALDVDPDAARSLTMFRDPIGMDECLTWTSAGVRIVTSRPEIFLPIARPDRFGIDWARAAQLLQFPGSAGETVPMTGVETVPTGAITRFDEEIAHEERLWSPADFAIQRGDWTRPPEECLPDLVDACIRAWASATPVAVAELSGGLDSAIVAAGLARIQQGPVRRWFHYYGPDAPGDERVYARAIAERLDIPVDELRVTDGPIDVRMVDALPLGARPSVASLSLLHHADMAARGKSLGATALFTGQGGDALFFQSATLMIGSELWRECLPGRSRLGALASLARWTGNSIWSTAWTALASRRSQIIPPRFPFLTVPPAVRSDPPHFRWLVDTEGLPPAKQLQIMLLAMCRAAFAPSWTTDKMTTIHPLFSQPIVERVLGLSALELTCATRDRALIRKAYARRLPELLLERPNKGCVSATYGRMLAASLPFLRDYLLGGMLAAEGILDRPALKAALTAEILMQQNIYAEIYVALFMERWVRGWTARMLPGTTASA